MSDEIDFSAFDNSDSAILMKELVSKMDSGEIKFTDDPPRLYHKSNGVTGVVELFLYG